MALLDPSRLVFLEETWTKTNMTRLYARAAASERELGRVPHGHWKISTFLAGRGADGAVNSSIFKEYVQSHLAPTLRPGDVVVMDNLSSHKIKSVRKAIRVAGARLA
jgi:hypothetical protein